MVAESIGWEVAKELGKELGRDIVVRYGSKFLGRLVPRKIKCEISFTVVIKFYQRASPEDVERFLYKKFLRKYTCKGNKPYCLKIDMNSPYEFLYKVTMTLERNIPLELQELWDIVDAYFSPTLERDLSLNNDFLAERVSSARIFIWPTSIGPEISSSELGHIAYNVFRLYRDLKEMMVSEIKEGKFGSVRQILYMNVRFKKGIPSFSKTRSDWCTKKVRYDYFRNLVEVVVEDSEDIKCFLSFFS